MTKLQNIIDILKKKGFTKDIISKTMRKVSREFYRKHKKIAKSNINKYERLKNEYISEKLIELNRKYSFLK